MLWLALFWLRFLAGGNLPAAEPATGPETTTAGLSATYEVQRYALSGKPLLPASLVDPLLARHTGTNVSLRDLVQTANELESVYRQQGLTAMNIVIAPARIAHGTVPFTIFQGAMAQILVAGNRYRIDSDNLENAAVTGAPAARAAANAPARASATNAGPHFTVEKYLVLGNTVLSPATIDKTLAHVDGAYGTNVTFPGIRAAATQLQSAYQERGFVTVAVSLPRQKLTNDTVKIQVTEGRLVAIEVKGNHYFSSNNVMRALPSLHTNVILNSQVFQAELNQANASQDRQIYPQIGPGPDPGTTDLALMVKDRFPLHAKVELNNESSPGTPDLRVNSSAVYDNLWQQEQSLGLQYSFSPELYKAGPQWNFYDLPQVANYSGFYRIPLGGPQSVADAVASHPGSFGYDEATRKFNLPPASGQPELTFFASQSTIDTGLTASPLKTLFAPGITNAATGTIVTNTTLKSDTVQQDLTVNNDLGFRLSMPLGMSPDFHQSVSGGLDFKSYQVKSLATNTFYLNSIETVYQTPPIQIPISSTNYSTVPYTVKYMEYLPLMLRYDASWRDRFGAAGFGLGLSGNAWFHSVTSVDSSGVYTYYHGAKSVRQVTSSGESSGYWAVVTPSFSQQLELVTNWPTMLQADGQWASEPLISNEQFGAGGVNSVRGYQEGQVFGDSGWHVSVEQDTPEHVVGYVGGQDSLTIRGSVYMDYADVYLMDPQGSPGSTRLWGAGFGFVASVGSHWEARFLFSEPLLSVGAIGAYDPYFNFALTAQF